MTKHRVVVTRRWPESIERLLAEEFDAVLNKNDRPFSAEQLRSALGEADALLPTVTDKIDASVLDVSEPRVRILANYGVGYSHIDVFAAKSRGIVVTNTPEVLSECTADLALTLMLMTARRAGEGEREIRAGKWSGWRPTHMLGSKLSGKTLGIVGFGRIGQKVAERAHFGFGMKIIAFDSMSLNESALSRCDGEGVGTLDELLKRADFVSLHCPGGDSNRNLMNRERLLMMKPGSFLINTARGEIVDEEALASALSDRTIAGAGLDVYAAEPKITPALAACENAVLLPHLGSASLETREAMGMRVLENLRAFFGGEQPRDLVTS